MPRRSRTDGEPLLALGDGVERQMRMARQQEQVEEAAPTDDEGSPLDVHALAHNIAQRGNDVPDDPFAFGGAEGGEGGEGDEEEEQVLEAVEVDGRMAADEDEAEQIAAEDVVMEQEEAGDAAAAAVLQAADTVEEEEAAPFVRPVVRRPVGGFIPGHHRGKGPKRRKVLRYVSFSPPLLASLLTFSLSLHAQ